MGNTGRKWVMTGNEKGGSDGIGAKGEGEGEKG